MEPCIETLSPKLLIGKNLQMSLAKNRTAELWQSFMPHRKDIPHQIGKDLYSVQCYEQMPDPKNFNIEAQFVKWAAVAVSEITQIPESMSMLKLDGGLYAVFLYKGSSNTPELIFPYIFGTWLPQSGYVLDHRPQFEVLGSKYKNNDPDSEEEIWIPIREKG